MKYKGNTELPSKVPSVYDDMEIILTLYEMHNYNPLVYRILLPSNCM